MQAHAQDGQPLPGAAPALREAQPCGSGTLAQLVLVAPCAVGLAAMPRQHPAFFQDLPEPRPAPWLMLSQHSRQPLALVWPTDSSRREPQEGESLRGVPLPGRLLITQAPSQ